jgi:hypothetical protein
VHRNAQQGRQEDDGCSLHHRPLQSIPAHHDRTPVLDSPPVRPHLFISAILSFPVDTGGGNPNAPCNRMNRLNETETVPFLVVFGKTADAPWEGTSSSCKWTPSLIRRVQKLPGNPTSEPAAPPGATAPAEHRRPRLPDRRGGFVDHPVQGSGNQSGQHAG